jgi:predicted nucleic acid-binding Zn finger protein
MVANEITGQAQEQRVTRAARESGEMRFTRQGAGWVVETASGGCYLVGDGYCGCADWKYRGSRSGVLCKHQIALGQMKIEKGL